MRKALNTGIVTGVVLSLVFIGGSYIETLLPARSLSNQLVFLSMFFGVIIYTLWVGMKSYSRSSGVKWGKLNLTGLIASIMAAGIFSGAAYLYTKFIHPEYLPQLMEESKRNWVSKSYSASSIAGQGEWNWFRSPLDFAIYNFQDSVIILVLLTLLIASIYYARHRKSYNYDQRNHELIF